MSESPPPALSGPRAVTTLPWLLVSPVASLVCGVLSLLLFCVYAAGIFPGASLAASVASGVTGVVLGHHARAAARHAAPGSASAVLTTTGLILSYVGTLLPLVLFALVTLSLGLAGPFPPGN